VRFSTANVRASCIALLLTGNVGKSGTGANIGARYREEIGELALCRPGVDAHGLVISARRDAPPPIDSSDKGANTSVNASKALKSSGMATSPVKERQADADRSKAEDNGYHRPAQHTDREHGSSGHGERPSARPAEPHEFETGGERQTNRRCRNTVEYGMKGHALVESRVAGRQRQNDGQRTRQQAENSRQCPGAAVQMLADLDGEVDPSGTGHEASQRRARQKLGIINPAPTLDDFAIQPARRAAPEAHHAKAKKSNKYRR
jgi:hypothetical protein